MVQQTVQSWSEIEVLLKTYTAPGRVQVLEPEYLRCTFQSDYEDGADMMVDGVLQFEPPSQAAPEATGGSRSAHL